MSDTETFARFFTVDEANALIPSLRPAIEELLGIRALASSTVKNLANVSVSLIATSLRPRF